MIRFIDESEVRARLRMQDLIPAMERALADFSAGRAVQPIRQVLPVTGHGGFLGVMPARLGDGLGAKLVTFYPPNAARGLHTHHALVVVFKVETGEPEAVMDGRLITEMRTAAVSAVATKLLSRPDAEVLAILGSGVQARSHWEALRQVRSFREVRVWSRTPGHARRFADEIGARLADTAERAASGSDVIVTATSATSPVLCGAWLGRGSHVNAVGACRPTWRELDDEAMRGSVVYVDSRESALRESGDVILSRAPIFAELGEAVSGAKPARPMETTVFKSLGMAVEDVAAARLVLGGA